MNRPGFVGGSSFNVNDDFNRESLRIKVDTSRPSLWVIRTLDELVELRGAPQRLRLDNGPEFISAALRQWVQRHGIKLPHIQPGKPTQNAYIERFNRTSSQPSKRLLTLALLGEKCFNPDASRLIHLGEVLQCIDL